MSKGKKTKKTPRPDHGGRFIPGWGARDAHHERVDIVLDDVKVREYGERVLALDAEVAERKDKVATLKREIQERHRDRDELVEGMVRRHVSRFMEVFKFADDAAGTVSLYDATTDELLQVREMDEHEAQLHLGDEAEES